MTIAESVRRVEREMAPGAYRWARQHRPDLVHILGQSRTPEQWLQACLDIDTAYWVSVELEAVEEDIWEF